MQTLPLIILLLLPSFCTAQYPPDKSFTSLAKALQNRNSVEQLIIKYPLSKDSIIMIEEFPLLRYLEISNQQNKINISFSKLTQLRKLILNSNFEALPNTISKIEQVDSLILYHNNLSEFPNWICELKELRSIGVVGNKIKQFPDCFFTLKKIENIYAGYNDISDFDERLFSFQKLFELSVSGNKISALPKNPRLPSSLHIINFSDNETSLESINAFQKIIPKTLWLIHNEYKTPVFKGNPTECIDRDTSAITIFTKCEICPQFQGGDLKFRRFLNSHLDTAVIPDVKSFSDSVIVRFAVFKEGGISKVIVVESMNNKLSAEAIRLIKESCAYWVPANFSGRLVNSWVRLKLFFNNKLIAGEAHKTIWVKFLTP